ncbi:MAG: threonine--tRNA ligase [Patescibacteria group bacterium]|nr:threonine--tRNA ligase [Patescibacteria group bacterium]MDE1943970.1 threonine--tRNA ligase [Patescibacteria group bacterium]MDE2057326.1 threonine--tRNA ligase [Patescibacteria group bacterium]
MSSLEAKRHTLAHLLAAAVKDLYEKDGRQVLLTLGPAIDTGFYYDIDFGAEKISEDDLPKIEAKMRELLPNWKEFSRREVPLDEAYGTFSSVGGINQYKGELIKEISQRGEPITLYTCGGFTDLCRGGHAEHPSEEIAPDSFKLDRIAGAYWRGDEKNPMLTRIYGLAFDTKEELDAYLAQREEAKKRDHRVLGKQLDLFTFSDLVGSGMPLFTPRGATVRSEIINYSRELNRELGFGEVHTPNVNKAELFKISGHYDQYKEDMLSVRSQYVEDEMFLKPMNCPQHTQIYASQPRSYRDLPLRYADFATLYRDERPGELSGLTRLRAFAQDDGHIFCREDQVRDELLKVLGVIKKALATYRIDYWIRLSLRDPNKKEKYLGTDADWERSQEELKSVLEESGVPHRPVEGEAAFYGPKLDIMAVDALGREWQISTIQVDRVQPARFELEYAADDGSKQRPVMIHRALVGSPDRFLGILIEHYAGAFPLWLAPVQVAVLPVSEKQIGYAEKVLAQLKEVGIRAELRADDSLGKRIREVKTEKIPTTLVVGDKEAEAGTVSVENNRNGDKVTLPLDDFIEPTLERINERANN